MFIGAAACPSSPCPSASSSSHFCVCPLPFSHMFSYLPPHDGCCSFRPLHCHPPQQTNLNTAPPSGPFIPLPAICHRLSSRPPHHPLQPFTLPSPYRETTRQPSPPTLSTPASFFHHPRIAPPSFSPTSCCLFRHLPLAPSPLSPLFLSSFSCIEQRKGKWEEVRNRLN